MKVEIKQVKYLGSMHYQDQKSISKVQLEQIPWVQHNFGNRPAWMCILGLIEELGELSHSSLKRAQGIRTSENHDDKIKDAVADIVIFLCDFCTSEGIDLEKEVLKTWNKVKKRDWKKDPTGKQTV